MPINQAAIINWRLDTKVMVILYDNVTAKRQNINIPANKMITGKKKIDANIPATKIAIASKQSNTIKVSQRTNASKATSDSY